MPLVYSLLFSVVDFQLKRSRTEEIIELQGSLLVDARLAELISEVAEEVRVASKRICL